MLSVLAVATPRPAAAQATTVVLPYRAPTPVVGPLVAPVVTPSPYATPYATPPAPYAEPAPVDEPSPGRRRRGHFPMGWLMPVGLALGGAFHEGGKGGVIGGEVSVVKMPRAGKFWSGGYADVLYDGATGAMRASVGPEVGWSVLGFDGGPYAQVGRDQASWGVYGRAFLALGPVIPYARMAWPARGEERFHELGVLLKLPITSWGDDEP